MVTVLDRVLNLCNASKVQDQNFRLESGSFETLINLSDEGLGMTLLPYLNGNNLSVDKRKAEAIHFSQTC